MTQSLTQIKKQIARLERQAEALRQKEIADVVARIRDAIAHYGLTADDLGLGSPRKRAAGKAGKKTRKAPTVKFRDAEGHTWSGHGRRPRWFVEALAGGKSADDLLA